MCTRMANAQPGRRRNFTLPNLLSRSKKRDTLTEPLWPVDNPPSKTLPYTLDPVTPQKAISPITMNSSNGRTSVQNSPRTPNGSTIRTVPAEPLQLDLSPPKNGDRPRGMERSESEQSILAKSYGTLAVSPSPLRQSNLPISNGFVRSISTEFGPTKGYKVTSVSSPDDGDSANGITSPTGTAAATGKSGIFIANMMAENDRLKRDLQIANLRHEESRNAVKLVETRMEQMAAGLERESQDASYNILQLKRRDRQLAEAKAQIEYEKHKAHEAETKERAWKDQLEEVQETTTREVAQAKDRAMLSEAGYNTVRNHWPNEQAKLEKVIVKMRQEMGELVQQRKKDDEKIRMLASLGEQQAELNHKLQQQNEALQKAHEEYKHAQDEGLRGIKQRSRLVEKENERLLTEARETLDKLRWALNVKRNVKDAE